jgi:hypothetical protein
VATPTPLVPVSCVYGSGGYFHTRAERARWPQETETRSEGWSAAHTAPCPPPTRAHAHRERRRGRERESERGRHPTRHQGQTSIRATEALGRHTGHPSTTSARGQNRSRAAPWGSRSDAQTRAVCPATPAHTHTSPPTQQPNYLSVTTRSFHRRQPPARHRPMPFCICASVYVCVCASLSLSMCRWGG